MGLTNTCGFLSEVKLAALFSSYILLFIHTSRASVRTLSAPSLCRAMENPDVSAEEKIRLLRASAKRHQVFITSIFHLLGNSIVLTTFVWLCLYLGSLQGLYEWKRNRPTSVFTVRSFKRTRTRKPILSSLFLFPYFSSVLQSHVRTNDNSSIISIVLGLRIFKTCTNLAMDTVNKSTTTTANVYNSWMYYFRSSVPRSGKINILLCKRSSKHVRIDAWFMRRMIHFHWLCVASLNQIIIPTNN
jgi:hypothetical protein